MTDIARQLQITDIEGREIVYTQYRNGNVIRESLDGSVPAHIVGYLLPDAKADAMTKYQQHIRFKGMIATFEWGESYQQAIQHKRFAEMPLPVVKKVELNVRRDGKSGR